MIYDDAQKAALEVHDREKIQAKKLPIITTVGVEDPTTEPVCICLVTLVGVLICLLDTESAHYRHSDVGSTELGGSGCRDEDDRTRCPRPNHPQHA